MKKKKRGKAQILTQRNSINLFRLLKKRFDADRWGTEKWHFKVEAGDGGGWSRSDAESEDSEVSVSDLRDSALVI